MNSSIDVTTLVEHIACSVQIAGPVAIELQGKVTNLKKIESTEKKQALTQADLASQEIILQGILKYCSTVQIIAEEQTGLLSGFDSTDRDWMVVIDPIDGTLRYFNGDQSFGIQVGVVHNGIYVGAVVSLPRFGVMLTAVRGSGAHTYFAGCRKRISSLTSSKTIFCHDKVSELERRTIMQLGFQPITMAGADITISPASCRAIAGIRPENISLFGRIGALVTLEAGGYCCDKDGSTIKEIGVLPMNSLIVAQTKEIAELLVSKRCCH